MSSVGSSSSDDNDNTSTLDVGYEPYEFIVVVSDELLVDTEDLPTLTQ
jgi:hypothetical protein